MLQIFELIETLEREIGQDVQVSIKVLVDELVFRIDWPNDRHMEYGIKKHRLDHTNVAQIIRDARMGVTHRYNAAHDPISIAGLITRSRIPKHKAN